ncbi:MAG: PKD domain-containing protein, partial [Runella sp.]
MYRLCFTLFLCFLGSEVSAQVIYGGHFDRRIAQGSLFNVEYSYRFGCTFYTDAAGRDMLPNQLRFRIIRKRDNVVVQEYTANKETDTQNFSSTKNNCIVEGAKAEVQYYFVRYNHDRVMNPTEYNDPEGYYVVNDPVGPRNPTVNVQSDKVVLYHWFSPQYLFEKLDNPNEGILASGWVPDTYSFACANETTQFTVPVVVNPAQSLVNGQTFNLTIKATSPLTDGALPFQTVTYKAGFNTTNTGLGQVGIVNANPVWYNNNNLSNVTVNVNPTQPGNYAIGFIAEHRRNGVKIAENYREWQVDVSNCIKTSIFFSPTVSEVGNPKRILSASLCNGTQAQLNAEGGTPQQGMTYQWFRNGQLIEGATSEALVINSSGLYYARLKKSGSCDNVQTQPQNIIFINCQNNVGDVTIFGSSLQSPYSSPGGGTSPPWWNSLDMRSDYYIPVDDIPKMPQSIKATFFRKRDHVKIDEVILVRSPFNQIKITKPKACENSFDTLMLIGYVPGEAYILSPDKFPATQGGYYVVTEPICCRASNDNLAQSNTRVVNYAEFNGANQVEWNALAGKSHFLNFNFPSRIEVCANQPANIVIGVNNKQNLSANLSGFTEIITDAIGTPVFKNVDWKSGFTTENFSNDTPALKVSQSGNVYILSGTPQKPGVYNYRIKFEGLQNGVVYSTIFGEFQLRVKDCRTPPQPTIFVSKVGKPTEAASTRICRDSLVQLNLRNFSKGSNFKWQFNGQHLANANDSILVVRNNQSGSYSVIVENPQFCPERMTASPVNITFTPPPTATFGITEPSGANCGTTPTRLTATATGNSPFTYQWLRDGQSVAGATSNIYEATNSGVYSVRVVDENGCVGMSSGQNVVPRTPPTAQITATRRAICQGQSVTLTATSGTGYVYSWFRNGQAINTSTNTLLTDQAGSYVVRITAPNNCSAESAAFMVAALPNPSVNIVSNLGNQICNGSTAILTTNGNHLRTYQWQRNGQALSNATQNTLNITQAGTYSVSVTDTNGCTNTSSNFNVEVVNRITVRLDSVRSFCGTSFPAVELRGTPAGGIYTGNGVVGSTFDPKVAGIGQHTITYIVRGGLECLSGEARRTVQITPPPL